MTERPRTSTTPPRAFEGLQRRIAIVVILLGPPLNIVMQVAGYRTSLPAVQPEIAWTTLHSTIPIVFAVCALVALGVGEKRMPIVMMGIIPYLWIPQTFYSVVADLGAVWPLMRSIDLVWALLLGMLALAYPRGRYRGPVERVVVIVGVSISVLRVGAVLLFDQPDPATCLCSPNVYALFGNPQVFSYLDLVYRVCGALIVLFVASRLFSQWIGASLPARTVAFVMPIGLTAWTAALVVEAVNFAMTRWETTSLVAPSATTGPVAIVSLFAVASVPICYVAGSLHVSAMRGRVADLMRITRDGADRSLWRDSLAATLGDPALEVYWWDDIDGVYRDEAGEVVDLPVVAGEPSRTLLPISTGDRAPIAVIRHDRALSENERLLDGVSTALQLAVDNGQLRNEVERTLTQVKESRQRIVEAGDVARKRLERDLHDGSQQQLVALSMQLRAACTTARESGQLELADELEQALGRLSMALRDLRELARGIHPTVLVEGGLALAMAELAARCPVPVVVESGLPERLPELVEATAYFVAAESLVNVARHSGARQAWLRTVSDEHRLRLVVRDNGTGGARLSAGSGLVGLVDRVEAVGGLLDVRSPRGEGTTIIAEIPLAPPEEPV
ncbi:MAG: histidine kinase [Microbacteriaceae bacterium]